MQNLNKYVASQRAAKQRQANNGDNVAGSGSGAATNARFGLTLQVTLLFCFLFLKQKFVTLGSTANIEY